MAKVIRVACICFVVLVVFAANAFARSGRPNVILVITDDQGYGDIAAHGNKMIQTPHLDKLHAQSIRLTDFHVDPTCSPTRAALMTGRYSARTGVWHTIMGRSLIRRDETTLAHAFRNSGYVTGISGKWHLGDNYPSRPQDMGFDETFIHGGGGVGQTPDYWGNDYFDDAYWINGKAKRHKGYCTDIWFQHGLDFIERHKRRPFFLYITTNAPHGPYLVSEKYSEPYVKKGVPATMAKFYGMITNIDENMGKLRSKLKELKLESNTILIFMSDNGTAAGIANRPRRGQAKAAGGWRGFNAGMRGRKGSAYDGGHRVPFFVYWPDGDLIGGRDVNQLTAHIDVLPTLMDLCRLKKIKTQPLDGKSFVPLLKNPKYKEWPPRTLIVQSHRIEHPKPWRQSSVMTKRWRLIDGKALFDMQADPGQLKDVSAEHPKVVAQLRAEYEKSYKSQSSRFNEYCPIVLGHDKSLMRITAHDWHAKQSGVPWHQGHVRNERMFANGYWVVEFEKAGRYEVTLARWPAVTKRPMKAIKARIKIGEIEAEKPVKEGDHTVTFKIRAEQGATRLESWLEYKNGKSRGAYFIYVRKL